MRKLLLASVLLSASLNAQTTFAPIGATWTYEQRYLGSYDSSLFQISCIGDTIIDGRLCSNLERTGFVGCMPDYQHVAVSGDSVLFHDPVDDTFRTLHVFGLSVGEAWRTIITRGHWDMGLWVVAHDTLLFSVTATDTAWIQGIPMRRMQVEASHNLNSAFLNYPFSGAVVERLGHSTFMFPWIDGACGMETNGPLRCYQDSDITWLNPQYPTCELGTGIVDHTSQRGIIAYPTVLGTDEPMIVTITDNALLGSTLEIFDAVGRIMRTITLSDARQISFSTPGAYFLRIVSSDRMVRYDRVIVR